MKKGIVIGLIMLLLTVSVVMIGVQTTGNASQGEEVRKTLSFTAPSCSDTDQGSFKKIPGIVTVQTWYGTLRTSTDVCVEGVAVERNCKGNWAFTEKIPCKDGCNKEGTACSPEEWSFTEDLHWDTAEPGDTLALLQADEESLKKFILLPQK